MSKSIEDFDCCPNCGSTFGYYIKVYASGWIRDNALFSNREPYNFEMHDSLNYSRQSKYYYCMECDERICKVNN